MVKIRLARRGRKKLAMYDVVVADARAPRDGRFIEKLGTYNPLTVPAKIDLKDDRAFHWLMQGAQPSDTVKTMLSFRGIMLKKHLQIGVIKGALTQEQADSKLEEWLKAKESKIQAATDKHVQDKQAQAKARKEAETKIREARAEAIRQKAQVAEAPPAEESTAEGATEPAAAATGASPAEGAAPTEEATAAPSAEAATETPAAEEAPAAEKEAPAGEQAADEKTAGETKAE